MTTDSKALFVKMIHEHQGIINSLCSVYFDAEEDQKDARQDIVLQLWKSWPNFRAESSTSTWKYRVSINTLLNKKRKESRRPVLSSLHQLSDSIPQSIIQNDDDLQLLKQFIGWLGDVEKAIVVLHLEGYQNKEIAEMLQLTATNVSTRMQRIKSKMKTFYKSSTYVNG